MDFKRSRRFVIPSIICAALWGLPSLFAQSITEFPSIPGNPLAIISGPDGALWFAGTQIGRISTSGTVTTSAATSGSGTGTCVPGIGCTGGGATVNVQFNGIVTGPDGALWFANTTSQSPSIGRLTTAGVLTQFPAPSSVVPSQIAAGADGKLWFTIINMGYPVAAPKLIYRMTTAGVVTSFPTSGNPIAITQGPDGAIWFTETLVQFSPSGSTQTLVGSWIGRIDGGGTLTEYSITGAATSIAAGPDGALWFITGKAVGRMSTAGVATTFPTPNNTLTAITAGPDGALWATDGVNNQIVRMTTSGAITAYPVPTASSNPVAIVAGPDGALWFVEQLAGKIGRLALAAGTPPSQLQMTTSSLPSGTIGAAYSQTLAATGGTPPYTWSLSSGSFPAGLTLASSGIISGTPTAAGTLPFTVQVTDAASAVATAALALTINAAACTYTFTNISGVAPPGPFTTNASGGFGAIVVTTGAGCPWSVSGVPNWVTGLVGGVTATGSGIASFSILPNYGPNPRNGAITIQGTAFPVTQQSGLIPSSGFMPHLAAEGGWTTTFTLVNKGSFAADTQLSLSDNNGNPLAVPLSFPQSSTNSITEASLDQIIAPNASLIVQASGPANIPYVEGSAQMTSAGAVDGFAIFH